MLALFARRRSWYGWVRCPDHRHCARAAWTAPLHLVGAWLTADLLSEAARDVRARAPTQWGGREYHPRGRRGRERYAGSG